MLNSGTGHYRQSERQRRLRKNNYKYVILDRASAETRGRIQRLRALRATVPGVWTFFQAVFGNLTGEDARPTLWRGRPRPRPELRLGASFQGTISLTARRTPASPKALIVGYTPASRRDAQKIGRRFSAGFLESGK